MIDITARKPLDRHRTDFETIFLACVDVSLLRRNVPPQQASRLDGDASALYRVYSSDALLSACDPNELFDETWYRAHYRDVGDAVEQGSFPSAFVHFLRHGLDEGRWPTPAMLSQAKSRPNAAESLESIEEEAYLNLNPPARAFLERFPILTSLEHYNKYGRFLGLHASPSHGATEGAAGRHYTEVMAEGFDAPWYRERYLQAGEDQRFSTDPYTHYLIIGIGRAYSPSAKFDESFYRAFYPEIRRAIEQGEIPCGFYHFIVAGRAEGRLACYERKSVLEARIPGVTKPVMLERMLGIRHRLQQRTVTVSPNLQARILVLLPTMNPDITFGGYRSVFELIRRLHQTGRHVVIVCTEDGNADKGYFLWREENETLKKVIEDIQVFGLLESQELTVGPADTVVAYSLWDLYAADHIRQKSPDTKVILLAQEFEPIFYDNCSARALAEEAYRIPHFPLINSNFLKVFFEAHKIGVFGGDRPAIHGRDFAVFEHRINRLREQSAEQMRARSSRILVTYARPEGHAARNMFEILVLALRQVCAEGIFGPEWQFIGLGALTDLEPVPLGGAHKLRLQPKMSEEEYTRFIGSMDIGVSLMYAPHPSVVPFEFATTGALVVTNEYENRSAAELAAISGNIIAGRPTIEGIAGALREAVARVGKVEDRVRNMYRPAKTSWDAIFNDDFLSAVFDRSLPTAEIGVRPTRALAANTSAGAVDA